MAAKTPRISAAFDNEWNPEILDEVYKELEDIAVNELGYDVYPNQIEIIGSEGMLEAYATIGMPVFYQHWSFGKKFLAEQRKYKRGQMGLAYEIVINSNPCISYLMEENTLTTQTLVIAHAAFGHNFVFKNNYLFKQWTMADWILDYLKFAKNYVDMCEERYGFDRVEQILDAAHALMNYSVDKYQQKRKKKTDIEAMRIKRQQWAEQHYDPLLLKELDNIVDGGDPEEARRLDDEGKIEPTENLLYFIEKNAPDLKSWERELIRIVRKTGEYFYPQMQTQVLNEGFATYTHHRLIHKLYDRGFVDEAFMLEFCDKHSGVLYAPKVSPLRNPYTLGFAIYEDIERICTKPTKEDEEWFPYLVGKDPWKEIFKAATDYKDESFIRQFVSPKLIRDFKLMSIHDKSSDVDYEVTHIQDDHGYEYIRGLMADERDFHARIPRIEVQDVQKRSENRLILRHQMYGNKILDREQCDKMLRYVYALWRYPVQISSYTNETDVPVNTTLNSGEDWV